MPIWSKKAQSLGRTASEASCPQVDPDLCCATSFTAVRETPYSFASTLLPTWFPRIRSSPQKGCGESSNGWSGVFLETVVSEENARIHQGVGRVRLIGTGHWGPSD